MSPVMPITKDNLLKTAFSLSSISATEARLPCGIIFTQEAVFHILQNAIILAFSNQLKNNAFYFSNLFIKI